MSWEIRKFGDIVDKIVGGGTPSKSKSEYWNGDIYWVSVKDMSEGKYNLSETQDTISQEGLDNSSANLIPQGTLIISTRMGLGRAFINAVPMAINQDLKAIYPNKEFVDNDFLLWNYISKAAHIENMGNGATVKGIRLEQLKSIEIELPPLPTQKRIADILSAYDDLIENNLKRIKLLEQAAQNIYKEWFVNLRFPGHENTPIDEETGLPEGWRKQNLYDFAEIQMGYPFKAKDFNNELTGNPAIRIRDILSGWTKTYTTEAVPDKYNVEHGDILIGMDGIFHMGIWSGQDKALLVQRVCRLRANNKNLQGYLLESLRTPIKYYEQTISGATVAHLGAKHLKEIFILIPDDELLERLSFFNTFITEVITLNKQNQKLKAARDILLPRLMNRTIEV